jgi:hypothetical protein
MVEISYFETVIFIPIVFTFLPAEKLYSAAIPTSLFAFSLASILSPKRRKSSTGKLTPDRIVL